MNTQQTIYMQARARASPFLCRALPKFLSSRPLKRRGGWYEPSYGRKGLPIDEEAKRYVQVVNRSLEFAWPLTSLAFTSGKAVAITRRSLHRLASERIPVIAMRDQRLLVGPAIPVWVYACLPASFISDACFPEPWRPAIALRGTSAFSRHLWRLSLLGLACFAQFATL
jgi:hypothetical protein